MASRFSSRLEWPSPPNALAREAAALRAASIPFINFVDSNPTRVGLGREGEGLLEDLAAPAGLSYSPEPRGIPLAREALSAFISRRGAVLPPENLFLCASTSEAYGWLFKLLCDPGDAVLVPKPGYPLFDFLAGLEGVEGRPYRLEYAHPHGWRLDLDSLEAGLARGGAKAIVLINPNNPTGSYIGGAERSAIVGLAVRYGAALIVDEVFFGFPLEAGSRSSFLGEGSCLTFVLDGLSKLLGLPQMKLGWIAASGPGLELAEAMARLEIVADTYLSAATPVMNALPAYLGKAEAFGARLSSRLARNLASLRDILEYTGSPHRVLRCEGGWTALLEAPRIASEEEICLGLLKEERLFLHPGYYFDMEREAYFAASLILEPGLLEEGARRYREYFEKLLK
jgi:aspartate/methionine/tyrosine aminotransferase